MTIANLDFENSYTTDGVTASYDYTFAITDPDQVEVFLNGILQDSGYVNSPSLVTDGGSIIFDSAPAASQTLLLYRQSDLLQLDTLADNQALPPATIEAMIDKLTIIAQQLQAELNRTITFPPTSNITFNANNMANWILGMDPTNTILEFLNPVDVFQNAFPNAGAGNVVGPTVSVVNDIATFNSTNGQLIKDSGSSIASITAAAAAAAATPINGGRLYLTSGSPYADGNATTSLLYGPAQHSLIALNGAIQTFSQISISTAALATGNYDVYINSASLTTIAASMVVWSGSTPPTTSFDSFGRICKNSDVTKLFVGSVWVNGSGQVTDNTNLRGISNYYNAVPGALFGTDTTMGWTVTSITPVTANGNTTNGVGRVSFITCRAGLAAININSYDTTSSPNTGNTYPNSGIGINSTTVATVSGAGAATITGTNINASSTIALSYAYAPSPGLNFLQRLNWGSAGGTQTFYGGTQFNGVNANGISTLIMR